MRERVQRRTGPADLLAVTATARHAATLRWALWAALLGSVAMHAALPWAIALPALPTALPDPLRGLFVALGLASAAGALVVHAIGVRRPLARGALDAGDPGAARRITVVFVVAWALAEVPVLLGFVLALATGRPGAGAWGALLSLAAMTLLAPRLPAPPREAAALARSDVRIG